MMNLLQWFLMFQSCLSLLSLVVFQNYISHLMHASQHKIILMWEATVFYMQVHQLYIKSHGLMQLYKTSYYKERVINNEHITSQLAYDEAQVKLYVDNVTWHHHYYNHEQPCTWPITCICENISFLNSNYYDTTLNVIESHFISLLNSPTAALLLSGVILALKPCLLVLCTEHCIASCYDLVFVLSNLFESQQLYTFLYNACCIAVPVRWRVFAKIVKILNQVHTSHRWGALVYHM